MGAARKNWGLLKGSKAWGAAALALWGMLVLPGQALAITEQGCSPFIQEGSAITGDTGTQVDINIVAVDGLDPNDGCSVMTYTFAEVGGTNTTQGVTLASSGTGAAFFASTPSTETLNMPSPPFGGGSVTYRVTCTDGCQSISPQQRTADIVVQVNNYIEIYDVGGSFQSAPTGFAFADPLEAIVYVNGSTAAAGTPVTFTADTVGLELDGSGLVNTVTDDNGYARVTAVPNAGADVTHSASATTPNVSAGSANYSSLQEVATGQALVLVSSVPSTGFVGQVIPVSVRALSGGAPASNVDISWNFHSNGDGCLTFTQGPGTFSPTLNTTDGSGTASSQLTLTDTGPGCAVIRIALGAKGAQAKGQLPDATEVRFAINVTPNYSLEATSGFALSQTVRPGVAAPLSVDLMEEIMGVFQPVGSSEQITYEMASAPDANWSFQFGSPGQSVSVTTISDGRAATTLTASTLGSYAVKARYNGPSFFLLDKVNGSPPLEVLFNVLVQNEIVAADDDFTANPIDATNGGVTASVIGNDQYNGSVMTSQDVVLSIINNGGLTGASINPTGEIQVPGPRAGGLFNVTYQVCDALDGANCDQGVASIQVDATSIVAVVDDFSNTPIDGGTGGATPSLLSNDLFNNEPIFPSDVSLTIVNGGGLQPGSNLFVNANGGLDLVAPISAGNYSVTYQICENGNSFNCSSSTALVSVFSSTVRTLNLDSGDAQSAPLGTVLEPLVVQALDDGAPVVGVLIDWSVSGPATLSAVQSVTDNTGKASITLTLGNAPGAVMVTASRVDEPLASVTFNATAVEIQPMMLIRSGNMQSGIAGSRADDPIVVSLFGSGGVPLVNEVIDWQVVSGGAVLDAATSVTDANGDATMGFRFGPVPASVEIHAVNQTLSLGVVTMHVGTGALGSGVSGNNQTGIAGEELPLDFVLQVSPDVRKALGNVSVDWEVLAGEGQLRASETFTDVNGVTSNRLTLGLLPGENIVQATLPGGGTLLFTATGTPATAQLVVVSGNAQTIPTNDPSAPLVVELRDASGSPIQGVDIFWDADLNATVESSTSITDSLGRAQIIAEVQAPGAARVIATAPDFNASPVEFSLVGGVQNIDILNPEERGVGGAVDALCPALAALTNRSPEEEDLFQRCSEFVDNAGDNPDEVQTALGELPPDVGSTISDSGQSGLDAQFDNINTRFLMLHDEQRGGKRNQFNVGLWTPTGMLPLSMLSSLAGEDEEAEAGLDFDRWGFFATGTIGRGESDQTSNRPKFDYDIVGLTAGVDYRFRDSLIGGVALGVTDNDVEIANNGGDLDTKGWSVSAYLSWFSESQWYVDGAVSYGTNDYDISRAVSYSIRALDGSRTTVDQIASASTDGTQVGTSISVGRDWQKGAWNINSYLRGSLRKIEYDGYQERMISGLPGQGLALIVDGRSADSMTTALGAKATYVLSRDWGVLMPTASVEWEHEYEDDVQTVVSRFAFDPTATPIFQNGDEVDTDYFNVGVGVSAIFPGGKSAYLYYEQLVGSANLTQGILSIGGRIEF